MSNTVQQFQPDPTRGAQWPISHGTATSVHSEMVTMRDGVRLATDLVFPESAAPPFATILIRTPYDKRNDLETARTFAEHGYGAAVQDVRGKFESEGHFSLNLTEREDGSDTVDWIAAQEWSNGGVGTYGCSYPGENQLQLAATRNPHHRAAIAKAAGGVHRYAGVIDGGVVTLGNGLPWLALHGGGARQEAERPAEVPQEAFGWLPSVDIVKRLGTRIADYENVLSRVPTDPWWTTRGFLSEQDRFSTPVLLIDGWFDYGVGDTLKIFELLRRNTDDARIRAAHRLIVSPSLHCEAEMATSDGIIGELAVGDASRDFYSLYLRWFDYWLREGDDLTLREPRAQLFVMGAGGWRCSDELPPEGAETIEFYLHSRGGANTRQGDGTLTTTAPGTEPPDEFLYQPLDPVPSVGGPLFYDVSGSPAGPWDQSRVEERKDVLVYTTPPLGEAIEVTGLISLTLFVSSDCPDTDFTAKLVDVAPDGTALNLQDGITRVRYRHGYDRMELLTPGQVVEVDVDLHATSRLFPVGNRIRLQVSSSNFPVYERNLNTGGANFDESVPRNARNRVFHDHEHPSRLLLPVISATRGRPIVSGVELDQATR